MRDPEYYVHTDTCPVHVDNYDVDYQGDPLQPVLPICDCGAEFGERCICGERNKCEACIERLIDNAEYARESMEDR